MGGATARPAVPAAARGPPAALRDGGGGGLHAAPLDAEAEPEAEPEGSECLEEGEDAQCDEEGVEEEGVEQEEYVEEGVDDEDEDGSAGGRLGFRPHDDGDLDEYV